MFLLNDSQPDVSWSLLDHERVPKAAYEALRQACTPVLVAADWPAPAYKPGATLSLEVHVVNNLLEDLAGAVVEANWPGRAAGENGCRRQRGGQLVFFRAQSMPGCPNWRHSKPTRAVMRPGPLWPLELNLELRWGSPPHSAFNRYESQLVRPTLP